MNINRTKEFVEDLLEKSGFDNKGDLRYGFLFGSDYTMGGFPSAYNGKTTLWLQSNQERYRLTLYDLTVERLLEIIERLQDQFLKDNPEPLVYHGPYLTDYVPYSNEIYNIGIDPFRINLKDPTEGLGIIYIFKRLS